MKTGLLILSLLLPLSVSANTTYLYIILHDDNSSGERFRTAMKSMKQCLEVLKHSKLPMPTTPSGDYEVMGAMFCGSGKFHRNFNSTWWNDPIK